MQIQVDLPESLNQKLKVLKAKSGDKTLQETLIKLLEKSLR